ncbi:MAG: rhamnulose-1-phosphate aldolase [candidate division WOR-3 bacterium]|nr:MAG: rhamnulose-1-phosphate aldolase [candidate division WOR-3 bacterium]
MHRVPDSDSKRFSLSTALRNEADAIAETAYCLWERGWAESSAGNISVDVTRLLINEPDRLQEYRKTSLDHAFGVLAHRYFFVTAHGARFRELAHRPDEALLLICIAASGEEYYILRGGEESRVTSEIGAHLGMHAVFVQQSLDARAVVHVHPPHLVALTQIARYTTPEPLNKLLWSMYPEMKIVAPTGIGYVPYTCPGTQELACATQRVFTDQPLIIWEKHGCVAWGRDVHEAFDIIACAEKAAEIFFICRRAGYEPEGLTPEQLRELDALGPPKDVP